MPHPSRPWPAAPSANHYDRVIAANRAKRAATFDALLASLNESSLNLKIALHAGSRRRLADAAEGVR